MGASPTCPALYSLASRSTHQRRALLRVRRPRTIPGLVTTPEARR